MTMQKGKSLTVRDRFLFSFVAWTAFWSATLFSAAQAAAAGNIGREVAIPAHLQDGQEFQVSLRDLLAHGKQLFTANWTSQEGGGRPLTKGTGAPLSDPFDPLV